MRLHSRVARVLAMVLVASGSVVVTTVGLAAPAQAAANCHYNNIPLTSVFNLVVYNGPTGDERYPATLHGATVDLRTNSADASVRAILKNGRAGDILSVDRSNFLVAGGQKYPQGPEYEFKFTSWIQGQGTWDYCEATVRSGFTSVTIDGVDGAHRYVRVCVRRSGVLSCSKVWYGDNDDDTGDAT